MPFTLHEVSRENPDFTKIVPMMHAGYSDPFNGFWEILKGPSLEECVSRYNEWHSHDPTSRWVYLTDDDTGDVVGAMGWNIHEKNPFENGSPEIPAYWWPEVVSYCMVHPSYRHRGAASILMDWGLKQADEMELDTFVESTQHGRGLYEFHGFKFIDDLKLDADVPEPSADFIATREKLQLPLEGFVMLRPKGGK
ncbi:hypothetical protein LSUE1_G009106 [Lachnellula suecica]|uniref:N-acetyltransferase domain-containing protein n=1 Tax=Lachnellula suecica TaxID=602035 RepID=A0A8T9BXW7_9HELO|nr:hypothetical protein LSUE1_G009106 [Lachnellula suecica]